VNNAGVLRAGYFEDLDPASIDLVLDTNLRSSFFVTQPAWHLMKAAGYGRIVMTGSSSGLFSHQGLAHYASAKAGLYGLTKALAYEGSAFGIKTNILLPYAVTSIGDANPIPDYTENRRQYLADDADDRVTERNTPKLTACLAVYLASQECAANGEAFSVCGGRFARVFVGVSDGWIAPDAAAVDPDLIASHIEEIRDTSRSSIPFWLYEELAGVAAKLT
jgi:NAD(P)-dependent dehydrogenase (short-subunit alcohol dehydrogenase family)